jgi:hypothetical protein
MAALDPCHSNLWVTASGDWGSVLPFAAISKNERCWHRFDIVSLVAAETSDTPRRSQFVRTAVIA